HAKPHAEGGPTCPCNLVPLCRRHHRAKTHSAWRYAVVEPGTYDWTSPTGRRFLVDHAGTRTHPPDR
ncbi:MAG TPA: HNH endonuclease signature motif containing protein, partial [Nocardioides sp.]|nr:HNH endonuclease signature motif containing protein [Nocardioides sp.]